MTFEPNAVSLPLIHAITDLDLDSSFSPESILELALEGGYLPLVAISTAEGKSFALRQIINLVVLDAQLNAGS